ncbi:unnamed protein product [Trichogramma brassicae]|uniref:CCHC-type domain-containing protein n=1 Tax=Trichogramma brassicae TaxID=86971 RepID=A0A6H5IJX0_9HYME|nr:unnamed protein product [Trichogramma brassicae]
MDFQHEPRENIKIIFSSIRHPQSNLVERYNKEIGRFLRTLAGNDHPSWANWCQAIAENNEYHGKRNYWVCPLELQTGQKPERFWTKYVPTEPETKTYEQICDEARGRTYKKKARLAPRNGTTNIKTTSLDIGNLVLVKALRVPSGPAQRVAKLLSLYEGPYEIDHKRAEATYDLKNPRTGKIRGTYHISNIRPYFVDDQQTEKEGEEKTKNSRGQGTEQIRRAPKSQEKAELWETILRTIRPEQREAIITNREFYLRLLGENAAAIQQTELQIKRLTEAIKARIPVGIMPEVRKGHWCKGLPGPRPLHKKKKKKKHTHTHTPHTHNRPLWTNDGRQRRTPQPQMPINGDHASRALRPRPPHRRVHHRPDAIIIKADDPSTYANILKKLKGDPALQQTVGSSTRPREVLRKAYAGTQVAVVALLPDDLAATALKLGHVRIGWVNCRIRAREEAARCYHCWSPGHVAARCKGPRPHGALLPMRPEGPPSKGLQRPTILELPSGPEDNPGPPMMRLILQLNLNHTARLPRTCFATPSASCASTWPSCVSNTRTLLHPTHGSPMPTAKQLSGCMVGFRCRSAQREYIPTSRGPESAGIFFFSVYAPQDSLRGNFPPSLPTSPRRPAAEGPLLLRGTFNAWSTEWGCRETRPRASSSCSTRSLSSMRCA